MIKYIKSKYFMLFLLMPFFKPICLQYFTALKVLEAIFVIWKVIAAGIILVLFILYMWQNSKAPKLVILVALFESSIIFSTVLNSKDLYRAEIDTVTIVSYTILLVLGLKYYGKMTIHLLSRILGVLVLINLISEILYPSGLPGDLYTNLENPLFFMTIDNGSALFLIFSVVIFIVDGILFNQTLKAGSIIMILCSALSAILSGSATAVFSVGLICITVFFIIFTDFSRHQHPIILFIIYIFALVYLITMQDNVISEFVLQKIFNRSSNLTGRYYLWESAINMIKAHPWLGYGRSVQDYIAAWGGYYSSHNYVLETLLQGGVSALTLFVIVVVYAVRKSLYTHRYRLTVCIVFGMFSIFIAALLEAEIHSVYIFGIISLCAGSCYLEMERGKTYD